MVDAFHKTCALVATALFPYAALAIVPNDECKEAIAPEATANIHTILEETARIARVQGANQVLRDRHTGELSLRGPAEINFVFTMTNDEYFIRIESAKRGEPKTLIFEGVARNLQSTFVSLDARIGPLVRGQAYFRQDAESLVFSGIHDIRIGALPGSPRDRDNFEIQPTFAPGLVFKSRAVIRVAEGFQPRDTAQAILARAEAFSTQLNAGVVLDFRSTHPLLGDRTEIRISIGPEITLERNAGTSVGPAASVMVHGTFGE